MLLIFVTICKMIEEVNMSDQERCAHWYLCLCVGMRARLRKHRQAGGPERRVDRMPFLWSPRGAQSDRLYHNIVRLDNSCYFVVVVVSGAGLVHHS